MPFDRPLRARWATDRQPQASQASGKSIVTQPRSGGEAGRNAAIFGVVMKAACPTVCPPPFGRLRHLTSSHLPTVFAQLLYTRASPCYAIAIACINGRLHCSAPGMQWPVCCMRPGGAAGMTVKVAYDPSSASSAHHLGRPSAVMCRTNTHAGCHPSLFALDSVPYASTLN